MPTNAKVNFLKGGCRTGLDLNHPPQDKATRQRNKMSRRKVDTSYRPPKQRPSRSVKPVLSRQGSRQKPFRRSKKPFRFLDLPLDIQKMVYDLCLISPSPINVSFGSSFKDSLLMIAKTMFVETKKRFHSRVILRMIADL